MQIFFLNLIFLLQCFGVFALRQFQGAIASGSTLLLDWIFLNIPISRISKIISD
jgi:hypothetical protein